MSPDLTFILTLTLRMAVTAAFVVSASVITERSGPAIGALVATLPISAGPSFVFLSLDHDAAFISAGALVANAIAFAICVPPLDRFRHVRMPLITRRWYDIPLRASLVATLVATVVTLSGWVGPGISGVIALFPVVFTSMMLILHPRIGGPPTAAVIANSGWGLMGFGIAIAVLNVAALRFGSAIALSLALATCVNWNLGLWWNGRRKLKR
jgi:hypothetical protein